MAGADDRREDDTTSGESPGRMLSRARCAQGLELTEVAARLHLSVAIVEAIEADDDPRLPAPIYVRGYLRKYATLVGVAGDELVARYNTRCGEQTPPLRLDVVPARSPLPDSEHPPRNTWLIGGSAVLLLLIIVLIFWLSDSPEQADAGGHAGTTRSPSLVTSGTSRQVRSSVTVPTPASKDGHSVPAVVPASRVRSSTPVKAPGVKTPAVKPVSSQPGSTARTRQEKAAATAGGNDIITLRFHEASWVEIRDATGRRLLFRTARPGAVHRLRGRRPFSVFLGNAPGVELRLNGKPVDLKPHTRRSRTARLTLGR